MRYPILNGYEQNGIPYLAIEPGQDIRVVVALDDYCVVSIEVNGARMRPSEYSHLIEPSIALAEEYAAAR